MCNPFFTRLELATDASASEVTDRLSERIKPINLPGGFEASLHPMGTAIGFVADGQFQLQEAMFGFGGAKASGTIERMGMQTVLRSVIVPSPYMSAAFVLLGLFYIAIVLMFVAAVSSEGFSAGRTMAFVAYSGIFGGLWVLMRKEMGALALLLRNVCEPGAA